MDKKKKVEIGFSLAALIFIIAAAISFLHRNSPVGVVFLCISSSLIIIGRIYCLNKDKNKNKNSGSFSNDQGK